MSTVETPTVAEVRDLILTQLENTLGVTTPLLPLAFQRVLAKTLAAVFILLYKYGGFMFLQMFVRTATASDTEVNGQLLSPLKEWGRLRGVTDPDPGTQAELLVDVTVLNQSGFLFSGSQLLGTGNGVTYLVIGDVALNAPVVQATIRASYDDQGTSGYGIVGNLNAGDTVEFVSPPAAIEAVTTVDSQTVTGADEESTEAYRDRVLDAWQKIPQGGAYSDYEKWGKEAAGVINIYPYASDCPGQVDVYVEATVASSGSADGIPTTAQLESVLDSVELDVSGLASRRPVGTFVNSFPISRTSFQVSISNLEVDNEGTVLVDIEASLNQYFAEREPFIAGLSVPPRRDIISNAAVLGAVEDVVSAASGYFSSAVTRVSVPTLDASTYSGDSASVGGQEATPEAAVWSPIGDKIFVAGAGGEVFEYDATDFDPSTMAYNSVSADVSTQEASIKGIRFNSDGTKMFIVGAGAEVFEYTLPAQFSLDGPVTYTGFSFDVSTQEATPEDLGFSPDGKRMYVLGAAARVFEYGLAQGFDLESFVTYTGKSGNVSAASPDPTGFGFISSGRALVVCDRSGVLNRYTVASAYDLGSLVQFTGDTFDVTSTSATPKAVDARPDLSEFSVLGGTATVKRYAPGEGLEAIDIYPLGAGEKAKITQVTNS